MIDCASGRSLASLFCLPPSFHPAWLSGLSTKRPERWLCHRQLTNQSSNRPIGRMDTVKAPTLTHSLHHSHKHARTHTQIYKRTINLIHICTHTEHVAWLTNPINSWADTGCAFWQQQYPSSSPPHTSLTPLIIYIFSIPVSVDNFFLRPCF